MRRLCIFVAHRLFCSQLQSWTARIWSRPSGDLAKGKVRRPAAKFAPHVRPVKLGRHATLQQHTPAHTAASHSRSCPFSPLCVVQVHSPSPWRPGSRPALSTTAGNGGDLLSDQIWSGSQSIFSSDRAPRPPLPLLAGVVAGGRFLPSESSHFGVRRF